VVNQLNTLTGLLQGRKRGTVTGLLQQGRKRGTGQIRGDGEAWGSRVQRFELVTTGEGFVRKAGTIRFFVRKRGTGRVCG
jgi:hypothetical protein